MSSTANTPNPTQVKTGKVRFSYLNVFSPKAAPGSTDLKYSVSLLIPKNDKETLSKVKAAIKAAVTNGSAKLADKNGKVNEAMLKMPLRDGDAERPDDEAYAGHFFLNATSFNKPGLVDANLSPIMDQNELYSGCFGRAVVNFYAFNKAGNKGVACGLNHLQKLTDGDALSGSGSPTSAFDDGYSENLLD